MVKFEARERNIVYLQGTEMEIEAKQIKRKREVNFNWIFWMIIVDGSMEHGNCNIANMSSRSIPF